MGDYNAIADIGETLIKLLKENMGDIVSNQDAIVLGSPGETDNYNLILFLYKINTNPYLRNEEPNLINSNQLQAPPLTLDLYYLLMAHSTAGSKSEHQILGRAMQILNDFSILRGSILQGNLAGSGETFRVSFNPISIDELTKIWSVFPNKAYKTSVSYIVSPVYIESTQTMDTSRVVNSGINYRHKYTGDAK